jgi:Flp pilus assembly protein TadD
VALVLPNKTQTRIAKNSELFLKSKEKKSEVKLKLGKLWSKTNKKPVELKINAPNAVASIRGTEWVVEVDQDGESSLAVMEGEIELASSSGDKKNIESGSVAAVNKSGKISVVKIINPEEYLQFVYSYRIEPLAYLPEGIVSDKSNVSIIRRLGASPDDLKNKNDINLANSLKLGTLPLNHSEIPSGALKLIEYVENDEINKILEYKPNNWSQEWIDWFQILKIESFLALGDDEQATKNLISIKPQFSSNFVKIKQLMSKGLLDEAGELASELLKLDLQSVHLAFSLGEIEEASGNLDQAYIHYKIANTFSKHWTLPMLKLSSVSMTKGKYDEAKFWLQEAEKNDSKDVSLASNKAEFFSLRNDLTSASKTLETLFESGSADFQAYTASGIVELKKGNSEEALSKLIQATALERNYSRAYSFLAVAHLHAGEPEVAFRQLEMAESLDPNDPLPNLIASQIHAGLFQPEKAVEEAEKVKDKSDGKRTYGQLANDQQGGANVGRRFLEVGLPKQALEAAISTKKTAWAGSYLFDAATAESNLERNSKYIMGFILDSQTFGSRRDSADIMLKPGEYGYKEYGIAAGAEDYDISFKYGKNGREIDGNKEYSYLYDVGAFAVQRDAYNPSDDTDASMAALGFMGLGWRENYDTNKFFTANVVPFYSDSSYPIRDNTIRLDYGASKRSDKFTRLYHLGFEAGDANVDVIVEGGCRGKDNQETSAFEAGFAELGRETSFGLVSWSIEAANRNASSFYRVNHPSGGNCTDLSLTKGNYTTRLENIDNTEYDFIYTGSLERKIDYGTTVFRLRGFNYQHNFDQSLLLNGAIQTPFMSNADKNYFKPSLGLSTKFRNNIIRIAYIEDYHPLSQASLSVEDTAGVPTRFEFMNPGGRISQGSIRVSREFGEHFFLSAYHDNFEIFNNPIYKVLREQWNADLLENFTLDKYENPNLNDLFSASSDFAAAEFTSSGIGFEKSFIDKWSLSSGFQVWEGKEVNHPNFDQGGFYGRVVNLPESLIFLGFTRDAFGGIISGRVKSEKSLVKTSLGTAFDQNLYDLKLVRNLQDNLGQMSLGVSGGFDDSNDHKLSFKYRVFF